MRYLEMKKRAFMSIVNSLKGFVRTVIGTPPITLYDCVDENSIINYTISGENVGDYDEESGKYKIPVKISGKNLLKNNNTSKTVNGITFTANADGSITINGTNTGTGLAQYPLTPSATGALSWLLPLDADVTYTLSCGNKPTGVGMQLTYKPAGTSLYMNAPRTFTATASTNSAVYIFVNKGVTVDNLTLYPQLEKSEMATDFEPYVEPITRNIYIDEPLGEGKILKNPAKLPTFKGTTIYEIDTNTKPSNMSVTYYSSVKGE